ncbi:hypothetical protein JL722_7202 [Aureococcus anophagefferens]|nr:hypothetical protein JL722_7202 [Aureococcus anophagefferens]
MAHPGKVGFYSERDDLGERFVRALEVDGERAPEEPSFCCYWSPTSDMCGDCPDPQTDGCETYPPDRGFWLGFFAAISVAADDVVVDLNGHEIRSSREFLLRQRFFSIIELADKPFKANSGPPQSAIYGVLFHKTNVAIHEFAACSAADVEDHENDPLDGVELIDVEIKELKLAAEEIVAVKVDGRDVTGPAGDVLQIFKAADAEGYYAPNALIEAQFAMRGLHEVAAARRGRRRPLQRLRSLHIPKRLAVDWRHGDVTLAEAFALMEADGARVAFKCSKDSMGHHNKGVVGLRLEFVTDVSLRGLKIHDLENVGLTSQFFDGVCEDDPLDHHRTYKGSDVRGVTMSYVGGVSSAQAKIGNLRSPAGAAVGAELRTNVLTTKLADVAYGDIQGADFDRSHHLVVHDAANPEVSEITPPATGATPVARFARSSHIEARPES